MLLSATQTLTASKETKPAPAQTATVSKKPFKLDKEWLAVIALLLLVLFSTKGFALQMNAPESIIVSDRNVLTVDLVNDSNRVADISVKFFSPSKYEITAPTKLNPNSSGKAKITIFNDALLEQEVNATIEARVGKEIVQKEVRIVFTRSRLGDIGANLAGMFSFAAFGAETQAFTLGDWFAFWILVIIAAVLVIAFVARLGRRV